MTSSINTTVCPLSQDEGRPQRSHSTAPHLLNRLAARPSTHYFQSLIQIHTLSSFFEIIPSSIYLQSLSKFSVHHSPWYLKSIDSDLWQLARWPLPNHCPAISTPQETHLASRLTVLLVHCTPTTVGPSIN